MSRKTDGIDINIGVNLREIRKSKNLTQTEVGKVLNITPQQIAKYEAGRNRISASTLYRLACYYDVDIGVFLDITKAVREYWQVCRADKVDIFGDNGMRLQLNGEIK